MSKRMQRPDTPMKTPLSGDYYKDLRLDSQLCFALYSASNKLTRLYGKLLEPLGLTFSQALALMALWERSPRTVGEIADALELDNGTITPLLKRLEHGGFVVRMRDAIDERRVNVALTKKGLDLREPIVALRYGLMCVLPVDEDEIHALRTNIDNFSAALAGVED